MATLGVQMMMLREQVAEQGMFPVLERLAQMDIDSVEVSQIPMNPETTWRSSSTRSSTTAAGWTAASCGSA